MTEERPERRRGPEPERVRIEDMDYRLVARKARQTFVMREAAKRAEKTIAAAKGLDSTY
jgi:hypothetical protein